MGAVENLHETDSALHHASRHQALPAEVGGAVERLHRVRLVPDIEEVRRFHLHAKRGLEGSDARVELGLRWMHPAVEAIQLPQQIQLLAMLPRVQKRRRLDVRHRRISGRRVRQRGLVVTGEESGIVKRAPTVRPSVRHHHESRHVPVFRPQPVGHPGTKTGVPCRE